MDTEAYICQITEILTDINTYRPCTDNDTDTVTLNARGIISLLEIVKLMGTSLKKQAQYLTNFVPRCPVFYGLPKVHKKTSP